MDNIVVVAGTGTWVWRLLWLRICPLYVAGNERIYWHQRYTQKWVREPSPDPWKSPCVI